MVDYTVWEDILSFIKDYKEKKGTTGIMICGSLISGHLHPGSDIDILFLQKEIDFEMELIPYGEYPIDRLQANPDLLIKILSEETEFSDVLSLSFGSSKLIIEDSPLLRNLIEIAEQNIKSRNLEYFHKKNKKPHIVDGGKYTVSYDGKQHNLRKNGAIIL